MRRRSLGQVAYEAYGRSRNWVTATGGAMPTWAECDPSIRAAWQFAAEAVSGAVRKRSHR